jgi:DNA-binding MarR family transcriptional regulator
MSDKCICTSLRQAAQASTALYDRVLAPSGLKVTMFRLLRRIEANPDATITELAELVGLDRSTLGRNLKVLERQGLLVLPTCADARARSLVLTPAGCAALVKAVPLWTQAQSEMKASLGMALDNLLGTLERFFELETKSKDTSS